MLNVALLEQQNYFCPIYHHKMNYNFEQYTNVIQINKKLTLNKLFMALELIGLSFLGTSICFLMGEFSLDNGTLGIISLVLFLKLQL